MAQVSKKKIPKTVQSQTNEPLAVIPVKNKVTQVSTRFELEKNIIKILLLFGHEEVVFEEPILQTDEHSGELKLITSKTKSRVFEKIFLDLQQDEIEFSTNSFKQLYPKLISALNNNALSKIDSFVANLSPELANEVSGLVMQDDKYDLHDWERKNIFVKQKKTNLPAWVYEIILRFRCQLIDEKVEELQTKTDGDKDKHHNDLLEEIVQYHKLKTMLSSILNRVV